MTWKQKVKDRKRKQPAPSANGKHRPPPPPEPVEEGPVTLEVSDQSPFPEDPAKEAFAGLVGEFVEAVDPHTEASRVAVLIQFLVAFGNLVGRGPYFRVENTMHHFNLYAVIVGNTAKGRKGTSWGRVREPFSLADNNWTGNRIVSGMSSGEGLINEVRDPIVKVEAIKEHGRITGHENVETDPGVSDKRLLVLESEFASVLKQGERQGNILSSVLRQAWESGDIRTMTRNSPSKATGAHISIIGHITSDELRRYLSSTEAASGFGNRFMWVSVRRSKMLPDGGGVVNMFDFGRRISDAASYAKEVREMPRDEEARELWHEVYPKLSRDIPGLVGAMLGRAEANTMRLACLYALLDGSCQVEAAHLTSAIALWEYCERSTRFIFGLSTGDDLADEILAALKKAKEGMTRAEIYDYFARHHKKDRISRALLVLEQAELAEKTEIKTAGRPKEVWAHRQARKAC